MLETVLQMPGTTFGSGDSCWLRLIIQNPGTDRDTDLYILLDVFGDYWSYPSWRPLAEGLDFQYMALTPFETGTLAIIEPVTMPPVEPLGPLYFYAAAFRAGELSLDALVSNGEMLTFALE